jgi:cyclophilin family peptidyl-prolyl cis-trans isomerase
MKWLANFGLPLLLGACAGAPPPDEPPTSAPQSVAPSAEPAPAPPIEGVATTDPPPAGPVKVELKPPLDDAVTVNDPAIVAIDAFIAKQGIDLHSDTWRTTLSAPPALQFDGKHDYFWHIETSLGAMRLRLFPDTAPHHVTCAIYLARLGFYDDLIFHRIIKGFMAQGGCPLGTGTGKPGYTIQGEFAGARKHDKPGVLSTANAGPNTDGSQFFLTFARAPQLDGQYTIYGEIVDGIETLRKLESAGNAGQGKPADPPRIVRTWVSAAPKNAR